MKSLTAMLALLLSSAAGFAQFLQVKPRPPAPPFDRYPAAYAMPGRLRMPRIQTAEEKQYRTELRDAILHGYGVVDGGTEHERSGVNFGGHYVLVQWGCGTNCTRAALIDGQNGRVFKLPSDPDDDKMGFSIDAGTGDLRSLEFRWNSTLLGIPWAADGMTHYYRFTGDRWVFLKKVRTPDGHD